MNILDRDSLRALCQHQRDELCVSLYLPAQEGRAHPAAFKSLLKEAESRLLAGGLSPRQAEEILQPGFQLTQEVWSLQGRHLAWFGSLAGGQLFVLDFPVEERLWVQPGFYVKPLFWHELYRQPFSVLAISLKGARLFDCTAASENEVAIKNPPRPVDSMRAVEMAHAVGRTGLAALQSHASRKELQKDIQQFMATLQRAMERQLPPQPLVLAGVDELTTMFGKALEREDVPLAEETLAGNPDRLTPEELRSGGFELALPFFKNERRQALSRLAQSQSHHGPSSVRVDEIVAAAFRGQVEELCLPAAMEILGRVDPETFEIVINSSLDGAVDMLNECARETCAHDGKVYLFEPGTLPRPGATFRL